MAFKLRKPPPLSAKHEAYPYQLDALRAIKDLPYAAIFHEQGLGKTKIAIDLLLFWLARDLVDTVFVITKKTLVQNWIDELKFHCHITPRVLSTKRRENSIALNSPVLIYVMNYEVISSNLGLLTQFLDTCRVGSILDESQKIKNPHAKLTSCFHSITHHLSRKVIMTGTPVANRPYDIWSQIRFLDDGEALGPSFPDFKSGLDIPKNPSANAKSNDQSKTDYSSRLSSVFQKIRHFSIRETKDTAGIELPDKTILTHHAHLAPIQSDIYASYRDSLSYEISSEEKSYVDDAEETLKRLLRLVQCASNPALVDSTYDETPGKYSKLMQLLQEIDLRSSKAIIWTTFIDNIEWLYERLALFEPQKIHGVLPIEQRNRSISAFKQNESCRLLLATPGTAKEGLTLTVANHAIFFDRSFSLDDYIQAQDRIHRISQTENCFVHNIIASSTIDEWVDALLHAKYQAAQLVQGDITALQFDASFSHDLSTMLSEILSPQ